MDLVERGMELMVVGMGTVFAFLVLLVLCIYGAGAIIRNYFPMPAHAQSGEELNRDDVQLAVAIAAAAAWQSDGEG